nr:hypothetical protein [uncultured Mediterranean phage uvMED]
MDILNLQPDAVGKTDDTYEVEGYKDQIEEITQEFPEEDFRTPEEIAEAEALQQELTPEENIQPTAVETQNPFPEPEPQPQPKSQFFTPDENGMISDEQLMAAYGGKLPAEGARRALKLNYGYLEDKEGQLNELFKDGNNLEKQAQAFYMIKNDPELTTRYDHNGDGEVTYDDFFDTTNHEDWDPELKRLNPEVDAQLTAEWLAGLEDPTMMSRAKALWQQNGAGQNMARYINLRRRHALSEVGEGEEGWFGMNGNVGEGVRQNAAGAMFDLSSLGLEAAGRIGAAVEEGDLSLLTKNSDLDERLLQTKNEQSLEYLVNQNIARSAGDFLTYEAAYWALPTILTGGAAGVVGKGLMATKTPALIRAGMFLKPTLSGGKAVAVSKLGGGVGTTFVKPATGFFGRQKIVQGINMVKSGAKTTLISDLPLAAFSNLQEDGRGMIQDDGFFQKLLEQYPESSMFAPQIAQGINSPLFKQLDFIATETALGTLGVVGIGGFGQSIFTQGAKKLGKLPEVPGQVTRWGQKNMDQFAVSTKSWSTKVDSEFVNQKYWFEQRQKQLKDLAEAGQEQANKLADGFKNAFTEENMSDGMLKGAYGAYKNGSKMMGQGLTKARDGLTQVIKDIQEIKHTKFTGKKGSTNSVVSQTDIAKAAKSGINDAELSKQAEGLVADDNYQRYLDSIDPSNKTIGKRSAEALEDIKETLLGRDASTVDDVTFYGEFLDREVKLKKDWTKMSEVDRWAVQNTDVQNAVMKSLLMQLKDLSATSSEMIGKTDIFATDGPMKNVADNLVAGLHQVKRTQFIWNQADTLLKAKGGKLTPKDIAALNKASKAQSKRLLQETKEAVNTMTAMMRETGDEELAGAVLDVFKVSNDIHNWKDFDAFMKQQIVGGKFNGEVRTGELIKGLQKVMVQSILSGPKTPLRALMGTTVNSYLNTVNQAFGAAIRLPFTNDVATYKASMAKLKGQFELIPEAYQVFQRQWNAKFNANIADIQTRFTEVDTETDKLLEAKRIHVEQRGTDGEKAAFYINNITRNLTNNKLFGWSPRALAAVDDTFKHLLVRSRSKEIAMRKAMEEVGDDFAKITPEMLKKAEDLHYGNLLDGDGNINMAADSFLEKQFREATLTSELKGTAGKMDQLFGNIPLIKPFYLFARTGVNGLNFTYKNTPLIGALHKESIAILTHKGTDFTELAEYGIKNAADLKAARSLFAGRQAMGSTVVGTFGMMYMGGQLSGNGPADRQLKQQWMNAGWKPNHFYIGDVGFDYRSLEPYNVIFSTIADIGDNMELMGSEWAEKRLQAVAFVVGRGLQGKTYMSGLDQLMQISQMKPGALTRGTANLLNNSIPLAGARNEFGKWINPHMKELNSDMWSSIRNRNLASEALALDPLPEKSDLLNGKPINNWNIVGRSFNAISPISLDIRRDTPGRKLLLESNYDLKSTTYAYGGYSFTKDARVRAHFQNAIGTSPITIGFKKFKNVEEALNHLASRPDVQKSMKRMKDNVNNPASFDINPTSYPHNTLIDNVMNQARSKAWAQLQQPNHPGYSAVQKLMSEKDGHTSRTRENRNEILDLGNPKKN